MAWVNIFDRYLTQPEGGVRVSRNQAAGIKKSFTPTNVFVMKKSGDLTLEKKPVRATKMARHSPLSDQQILQHLKCLSNYLPTYAAYLNISLADIEYIQRQFLAFDWVLRVRDKLEAYLIDINEIRVAIRGQALTGQAAILNFLDLPRPPLFYPDGNIDHKLCNIFTHIRTHEHYTVEIGDLLGVNP